jgi:serine/threonine-protein kinase
MYTRHNEEFILDNLVEMPYDEAVELTKSKGLEIIPKDSSYNEDYEESVILAQNPKEHAKVKYGRRIYVTLSLGEKPIYVPNLIGISKKNAAFLLKSKGLKIGKISEKFSRKYPKGVVMYQNTSVDALRFKGDSVAITVSLGKDFSNVEVQNFVGMALKDAKNIALMSGLSVQIEEGVEDKNLVPGTVLSQSIEEGEIVEQNSLIIFTISK